MSRARSPSDAPSPTDREASAKALIDQRIAMLSRLAEIGMGIAEAAGRRAEALAEGGEAGAVDPGLSFARAARAVRLTLALQSRFADDLAALERGEAVAHAAEAARRRDRIHAHVERAAEAEAERDDDVEVETLSSAAWERLRDEDDADLLARPIEEVVALICQDLGLTAAAWTGGLRPRANHAAGPPAGGPHSRVSPPAKRERRPEQPEAPGLAPVFRQNPPAAP